MVFSNDKNDFFKNIDSLPDVIIDIIHSYIPKVVTIFLTKENYLKDHYLIRKIIDKRKIEQYIRAMVRDDNDFVLKHLLRLRFSTFGE